MGRSAERAPSRGRRWKIAVTAVLGGVLAAFLGTEALHRLAFARPELNLGSLGPWIRDPSAYADGNNDDDHWKLVARLGGLAAMADAPNPDGTTGWTGLAVTPGTYAHQDESSIGERQLVLLYGDSFAACATPAEECFPALLQGSDLGSRFAMLDYGVGGYGLDQSYLLLKNSIDRHAARRPIVIFSLLVESDFDRTTLAFRCWPKPRLRLEGEALALEPAPRLSPREYLKTHPISFPSYLWRRFLHQDSGFLRSARAGWRGDERREELKRRLNLSILAAVRAELEARELPYFFLVFHAEQGALKPWAPFREREQLLGDFCREHSVGLLDTREFLWAACAGDEALVARFYGRGSPLMGHHNLLGNRVCFEAMRQGILARAAGPGEPPSAEPLGPADTSRVAEMAARGELDLLALQRRRATLLGRPALITTHGAGDAERVVETATPSRVCLRADTTGFTAADLELDGGARRFTGRLHLLAGAEQGCPETPLHFTLLVDDRTLFEGDVPEEARPAILDVDLAGARNLRFVLRGQRGQGACGWAALSDPRLE